MVDQSRYEALMRKRSEVGLSDDEADELGRMMAEREGKEYSSARGTRGKGSEPDIADREPE
jgi:hypothetical protein